VYPMTFLGRQIIDQFISELHLNEAISRATLTLIESGSCLPELTMALFTW